MRGSRSRAALFDHGIPPGDNFDKAEFRLWVPPAVTRVRAVLVLVPGSQGGFQPVASAPPPTVPTAWLPTERIARAWQAVLTGKPFEHQENATAPRPKRRDRDRLHCGR